MKSHPGGLKHTRQMLKSTALPKNSKILDMGAGAGETLLLLRSMGYEAVGIDIAPRSEFVEKGDFLSPVYPEEYFDGLISQCAFFISGNVDKALAQAYRILKRGGVLMLSDVWFEDARKAVEKIGFCVECREDMTALWREYYLEALWRDDTDCCVIKGKCSYEMLICRKE